MMKINSELPLCMLEENTSLNEYDFVLFHLYKSNQQYREYYLNLRKANPHRLTIFDNSAYEFFVKNIDFEKMEDGFVECIKELNPDYYILPDKLMDKNVTLERSVRFMLDHGDSFKDIASKPMAVAQGDSVGELVDCLIYYERMGIESICLPFHNSFLELMDKDLDIYDAFHWTVKEGEGYTTDVRYAMGRCQMVKFMMPLLKRFKHIHFLGSHCPYEKKVLQLLMHDGNVYDNITMDTGFPVKLAIEGKLLENTFDKPNIIIDDFLDKDLDKDTKELVRTNVKYFKNL